MTGPTCIRCGGTLAQPEPGAQYECQDCGAVVAEESIQEPDEPGW